MRTAEERLEALHGRAQALKKQREVAWMRGLGGASGAMAVCLVALITIFGKGGHDITDSGYAGTSLLSEGAGGYVLVAVAAFFAGAVVVVLMNRRKQKDRGSHRSILP